MAKITYTDKVIGSKFTAGDANEIKTSVNDLYDEADSINTELDTKVDKVTGKGLSTEDYTTEEKDKLEELNPEGSRFDFSVKDIFAWGDSLTNGNGAGATPYPTQLATLTSFTVTNKGVGGETSTQIKDRLVADSANYSKSVIIWAGRNNASNPTTVKADIATMIATIGHDRYLVLSVLNGTNEPSGNTLYNTIVQLNNDLSVLYGDKYIDVRRLLVDAYDPNIPQDVIDFANDVPPSSLRTDSIHLNTAGYAIVAEAVNQNLGHLYGYNGYLQSKDVLYYQNTLGILNKIDAKQTANFWIDGISQIGNVSFPPVQKFTVYGDNSAPAIVGGASNGSIRVGNTSSDANVIDMGTSGTSYAWIQARSGTDYSSQKELRLNPNAGAVLIGGNTTIKNTLDVYGGSAQMRIGGDFSDSTLRTDSVTKAARVSCPHYLLAEESVALFHANITSAVNTVNIGGGTGVLNAATSVNIYAAANNITTTGTSQLSIDATAVILNNVLRLKSYTVATLPSGTQGNVAYVTDASAPAYLATVVGGGSVKVPVFYNGTNWVCH